MHLQAGMSDALDLDQMPDKPLLWRHGGRPVLPRSMVLLRARLRLGRLARALGSGGATGGNPLLGSGGGGGGAALRELAAAGAPLLPLLHRRAAEVAEAEASSGPATESLSRELLEAAVVAALRSDTALKRSVAQGLALMGVLLEREQEEHPLLLTEAVPRGGLPASGKALAKQALPPKGGKAVSSTALAPPAGGQQVSPEQRARQRREAVRQGLELTETLVSEVIRRAEAAVEACTALLLLQPPAASDGSSAAGDSGSEATVWLLRLTHNIPPSTASVPSGAKAEAPQAAVPSLLDVSATAALLPAALMVSPTCRELQAGLLSVVVSFSQPHKLPACFCLRFFFSPVTIARPRPLILNLNSLLA